MIPNEVFTFTVRVDFELRVPVIVEPNKYTEEEVKNQFFTKEKIQTLKEYLIKKIQQSKNPFSIYCNDVDGDYNITEEQLFNMEGQQ